MWEVRVFVGRDQQGNPRQVSRTVRGTKREAQRVAVALTVSPPSPQSHTVAEALDAWLETNRAAWAASTVRDQTSRVALVMRDPIAKIEVGRLTVADVDRWHARVRANGVGEASLRNQHLVLRAGLTQAARWDWVSNNVVAIATLGRRKTQPRAALSSTEVRDALVAAERIDTAVGLALRLAAVTGARRAELCALRWTDLVGDRLTVDSSIEIVRLGSVADKRKPTLVDAATKTANRRTVRLDPRTVAMFEGLRDERQRWGPWVLQIGDRPLNPERLTGWWRQARRDAGLDPQWRLHDLRHWSATEAIGRGHDIRTVAGRLGHANPAMTLRTYAHAIDGADAGVAVTLAVALDGEA